MHKQITTWRQFWRESGIIYLLLGILLLHFLPVIHSRRMAQIYRNPMVPSPSAAPATIQAHDIDYLIEAQDARLVASATARAECIHSGTCAWSHDGWKETLAEHFRYRRAGEVLGRHFQEWDAVMAAWDRSPSHKKVLDDQWCVYGSSRVGNVFVIHVACQ
jgi:hypothetical protein